MKLGFCTSVRSWGLCSADHLILRCEIPHRTVLSYVKDLQVQRSLQDQCANMLHAPACPAYQ